MSLNTDIAEIGALIGLPARTNMVVALMAGCPLTATELAHAAGVSRQTASGHLSKLTQAGLLAVERAGRHRCYRLASPDVGQMVEAAMVVARRIPPRLRPPSRLDEALRTARTCYDHLAGRLGVGLADALMEHRHVLMSDDGGQVTRSGVQFLDEFGINFATAQRQRRIFCRPCLDWSERRPHLAGSLGAALATRCFELGWIERGQLSRAVAITDAGRTGFADRFGVAVT
ncbi:MAG: helix-turn-helix transcriptional regulator [Acetobacteraceae bacterium]|nr:helix-turn-helix transcriptional regulator [Acetobacteraceae bacterium]